MAHFLLYGSHVMLWTIYLPEIPRSLPLTDWRKISMRFPSKNQRLALIMLVAGTALSCAQPTGDNTNLGVNTNTSNTNTITNTNSTGAGAVIDTREPDAYRATVLIKAETTGAQPQEIPTVSAEVARQGQSRRISFKLPNGETMIYLDHPDKAYLIAPQRKQYAELTPELTGFELQRIMTPGQIVERLKAQQGYELVGDDTVNGRPVTKYVYRGVAHTATQAGDVKADTFVYVDKATGLPLRSEMLSQAEGQVQGVKGLKIITEMRDIDTAAVDPKLFEIPQGVSKVAPEVVRKQFQALASVAGTFIAAILQNAGAGTMPAASPTISPSPTRAG
jgi:hypothetical protein